MPEHPTYAYSIESAGLWRYDEHGVELYQVGRAQLLHAKQLYANYKLTNGDIRWTPRPITVAKHEDVIYEQVAPGFWDRFLGAAPKSVLRRVRCGNTLSALPQLPVLTRPQAQLVIPAAEVPEFAPESAQKTPFLPIGTTDFPLTLAAAVPTTSVPATPGPGGGSEWPSGFAGVPGLGIIGPGIGGVSGLTSPVIVVPPVGPAAVSTPEPSTIGVFSFGLLLLAVLIRRKRAKVSRSAS